MIDLVVALRAVTVAFDEAGLDYLVVGSGAAAAWGAARSTRDIDIAVVMDLAAFEVMLDHLSGDDFYVPELQAREAARSSGSFSVLHLATGGKIDVFVVDPHDRFEAARRSRRRRASVLGFDTWVATPEDVLLAKLHWRLDSRSELQWRDCAELVAVNTLDLDYLHQWAGPLAVTDDLTQLLDEVTPPGRRAAQGTTEADGR